jgi:hypothetical protein
VLIVAGLLVGCGGGGGDDGDGERPEERAEAVELMAGLFAQSSDPSAILSFDAEQAGCAAEAVVEVLGVERLEELGMDLATGEPPTMAEPPLGTQEARDVYGGIGECIDLTGRVARDFVAGGLDEATARCAAERYLDTSIARDALGGSADPALPPKIDAAIAEAWAACGAAVPGPAGSTTTAP